ncbi:unnamed protein product [Effrenium voratum]|nr:unnamed protein product [Effrenium voratum]
MAPQAKANRTRLIASGLGWIFWHRGGSSRKLLVEARSGFGKEDEAPFAEAVNEVPKVLFEFLLIRAGSIGDTSELKAWVSKEEADRVHKTLEEFRDEVNEEKVMRRLNMKRADSEGSWSCISKGSSKEEKKNKAMVK